MSSKSFLPILFFTIAMGSAGMFCGFISPADAAYQNVTELLQRHPDYSEFNRLLSQYGVAQQINSRSTITVLCPNNTETARFTAMAAGRATQQQIYNVLSFHVLLDYEDPQKFRSLSTGSATITTLFQTTGLANGMQGFVNVTVAANGTAFLRPATAPASSSPAAVVVSSLESFPFNISILAVSAVIVPDGALTASSPPPANITEILRRDSVAFSSFANLLQSSGVESSFQNLASSSPGITIFAPTNSAIDRFLQKFGNVDSSQLSRLLNYHAVASFFSSPDQLLMAHSVSSIAGSDLPLTFSRPSSSSNISVNGISIASTVYSNSPVSIYSIDSVLVLPEMAAASPAPGALPPSGGAPSASPPQLAAPSGGVSVPAPAPAPSSGVSARVSGAAPPLVSFVPAAAPVGIGSIVSPPTSSDISSTGGGSEDGNGGASSPEGSSSNVGNMNGVSHFGMSLIIFIWSSSMASLFH